MEVVSFQKNGLDRHFPMGNRQELPCLHRIDLEKSFREERNIVVNCYNFILIYPIF